MKWYEVAKSLIGTREIVGPKHSPTILGWAKRLGSRALGIAIVDDETPWCGTFVAHCVAEAGLEPPKVAVRASSWEAWGANLRADRLAPGAVLVFKRPGGGHVGFYVGEDATAYHVLGGNQSNAVNVTRIAKDRCVARRWPTGVAVVGSPVWIGSGGKLSTNEA
ncbi:TIGR02594 family protein [Sphingomonas sp. H160509]|uniref:TIGR02594 family protein n=1 Tax=Sphingomonas sp. H160509 TaxID=2955313 RepID=UPI002097FBF6|nr:TIGR02594 family protein [Sphingomonas sp. H160509]MDD1452673.1 TIGR02594 family protein [Sphingomonas sp. H160509]